MYVWLYVLLYTIVDFKSSLELVLYIWFISTLNKALNWIEFDSVTECGLGSHLGTISVATPTYADDILILANSECELQSIMDIIYHHTQERSCENQPTEIRPHML